MPADIKEGYVTLPAEYIERRCRRHASAYGQHAAASSLANVVSTVRRSRHMQHAIYYHQGIGRRDVYQRQASVAAVDSRKLVRQYYEPIMYMVRAAEASMPRRCRRMLSVMEHIEVFSLAICHYRMTRD